MIFTFSGGNMSEKNNFQEAEENFDDGPNHPKPFYFPASKYHLLPPNSTDDVYPPQYNPKLKFYGSEDPNIDLPKSFYCLRNYMDTAMNSVDVLHFYFDHAKNDVANNVHYKLLYQKMDKCAIRYKSLAKQLNKLNNEVIAFLN